MYINTTSQTLIKQSICEVLNINNKELEYLIETCYKKFQLNYSIFILDDQYDYMMEYVKEHICKSIDDISFYHLSRRLNDNEDDNGYSLVDTLCHKTSLSRFLKKYGLTFKYDKYIRIYLNVKEIILDNYSNILLKQMLEYDYSFKGFALGDAIEKNDYYEILRDGPKLFGHLFSFVDSDAVLEEFQLHSQYYKFEYLVPIDQIYFVNYEDLTDQEKQYHIIVKALQRLYAYKYDSVEFDDDNPVIGMIDNQTLDSQYLVNKQEL